MSHIQDPLVSIGIPTFNRPTDLYSTILQIKAQTYQHLQVIISDNGGSIDDDVLALIGNDERFEVHTNVENIGLLRNTEKVFKLARGQYFCWFSDDDWHAPEFVEILLKKLRDDRTAQWAFSNFYERTRDGCVRNPLRNRLSRSLTYMTHSNKAYRQTRYYLDDHSNGKCNAFYGLFCTDLMRKLDFRLLSDDYNDYALDQYIVFEALKISRACIIHDALIALTCENQKYYDIKRPYSTFEKLQRFCAESISTTKQFARLVSSKFLRSTFIFLFIIRFLYTIVTRLLKKVQVFKFRKSQNWLAYTTLFTTAKAEEDRLLLDDVSLICVATKNVERAVLAMKYSEKNISFTQTILFSHYTPQIEGHFAHVKINPFASVEEWGEFMVYELHNYIKTKYILLVHDDGFVINAECWDNQFLNYDYIGAPWPIPTDEISYRTDAGELVRVGNSVSLRSKKLLELPTTLDLPWVPFHGFLHEDGFLTVQYRDVLKRNGVKYAPVSLAQKFGRECLDSAEKPFTFHKWLGKNKDLPNFTDIE